MGGYNSGGRNRTHRTVENYSRIDSFEFYMFLKGDKYLGYKSVVKYHGGDIVYYVENRSAVVRMGNDYCNLALSLVPGVDGESVRMYFHCPCCGRRVRYLYDFHKRYICRHCLGANYKIQSTRGTDKLLRQMANILVKLEYEWWKRDNPGMQIFELKFIPKPKYMRWDKYERYLREFRRLQKEYDRLFWRGMLRISYIPADLKKRVMCHLESE